MRKRDAAARSKPAYGIFCVWQFGALNGATILVGFGMLACANKTGSSAVLWLGVAIAVYGVAASFGVWLGVYALPENRVRRALRVASSLPDDGAERILDVGSGRGVMALAFAKRFASGRVVAVDIWQRPSRKRVAGYDSAAPAVRHSAERTRANALVEGVADGVDFVTSDARRLAVADEAFDVATCGYLLLHLHNGRFGADDTPRRQCLRELHRVIRTGGRLIVFEVATTSWMSALAWTPLGYAAMRILSTPLTIGYWKRLAVDAGFAVERSEERRGNVVIVARKI